MLVNILAIAALGAMCGAWILFQRWIARVDRNAPGIQRRCGACEGTCGET